jgi:hypothetical protein
VVAQDAFQPGEQFLLVLTTEAGEIALHFQKCLLHQFFGTCLGP